MVCDIPPGDGKLVNLFFGVYTAIEQPVKIQFKCLVPIYVFPEMKLLAPKQNHNVLSPGSYAHISVRDLYISRIDLPRVRPHFRFGSEI